MNWIEYLFPLSLNQASAQWKWASQAHFSVCYQSQSSLHLLTCQKLYPAFDQNQNDKSCRFFVHYHFLLLHHSDQSRETPSTLLFLKHHSRDTFFPHFWIILFLLFHQYMVWDRVTGLTFETRDYNHSLRDRYTRTFTNSDRIWTTYLVHFIHIHTKNKTRSGFSSRTPKFLQSRISRMIVSDKELNINPKLKTCNS